MANPERQVLLHERGLDGLIEDKATEENQLHPIHLVSNVRELKKLLLSGADINHKNTFNETPLLSALRREGDFKLIEEFVRQGADVNAKDCWEVSPLYCAVARRGRDLDIIRFLLENGADIESGKRVYDRFLDHTVTHNTVCAKLLVKYKFLKNSHLVSSGADCEEERDYYNEYKNIVDLDLKPSSYNFLASYLDDCATEICKMKCVQLCDSLSLLDFITTNNQLRTANEQQMYEKIYKEFTLNKYKIYEDMVVDRIGRETLLKRLDGICVYIKLHRPKLCNQKKRILNFDLLYYISEYLSGADLFNFVIASYK